MLADLQRVRQNTHFWNRMAGPNPERKSNATRI